MTVVHNFITSYSSKNLLLNFIKTPDFFYKISDTLKPDTFKFEPKIKDNLFSNKFIKWPQVLFIRNKLMLCLLAYQKWKLNMNIN